MLAATGNQNAYQNAYKIPHIGKLLMEEILSSDSKLTGLGRERISSCTKEPSQGYLLHLCELEALRHLKLSSWNTEPYAPLP